MAQFQKDNQTNIFVMNGWCLDIIQIDFGASLMSSRDEQQEVFYQEEQVLWAKIRGYPWWPAFVDKIHPPARGKETEYTVFFFGDNTQYSSSKLGASKLRKFYENYAEFYQKARAHRKLMTSIQMAEEKLKQNDQNVEIFEELRSNLKVAKKVKNNSIDRKSSKISEPDPQISVNKEELPDLNKSKTFAHTRRKKNHVHLDQQQQISQSVNQSEKNRKTIKKQEIVNSSQKKSKKQQSKKEASPLLAAKKKKNSKQQIFQEQSQQQEPLKQVVQAQLKSKIPVVQPEMQEEQQQESEVVEESIEQQEVREESSEDVVYQKKLRNSVKRKIQSEKHSVIGPRKRGRPKKKFLRHFNDEKIESLNRIPVHRISHLKRKIIHKQKFSPKKIQNSSAVLSEEDALIIQQLKKILHKRDELIDYLGSISITINNVQQILELGVSNILQQGDKNSKVNDVLFVLRNVLLYKYFPDDVKHKKKYEKILKRKPITIKNDDIQKEESQQNKESKQEQQIRKKTVVKLQKFLKMHPDIDNKAKQLAVRIESYFQKADSGIGDRYRSIAFKVLSNLKEKKETFAEVIKKLDQNAYD